MVFVCAVCCTMLLYGAGTYTDPDGAARIATHRADIVLLIKARSESARESVSKASAHVFARQQA